MNYLFSSANHKINDIPRIVLKRMYPPDQLHLLQKHKNPEFRSKKALALQDEMFGLVENWKESKLPKSTFIHGKNISIDKFNYWIHKYNKENEKLLDVKKSVKSEVFKEVVVPEITQVPFGLQKIIELTTPSGLQITIFG